MENETSQEPKTTTKKQKLTAILFSLLPMLLYFLLLILFTIVTGVLKIDYDKAFPLMNALSFAIAAAVMCRTLKKRTGKTLCSSLVHSDFDLCILLLLTIFSWCATEVVDGIVAGVCSGFMTAKPNASPGASLPEILQAVLIAPVFEEIIFRFLGLEFAEKYFPLPALCIANALYFALLHGYNIAGFFNVMTFALCMAYTYLKTRQLLYVIVVHMIHNAAVLIDYGDHIFLGSPIYQEKNGFTVASLPWIAVNFALAALCAMAYIMKYRKNRN